MARTTWDCLLGSLDDLNDDSFKRFTDKLCDSGFEPRIRRGAVEKKDRGDIARLLIDTYTESRAVEVAAKILRFICSNQTADELISEYEKISQSGPARDPRAPEHLSTNQHFIDRNRTVLIARVNNIDAILDELLHREIISDEDYSTIRAEKTNQNKMRALLDGPIKSAGTTGKNELYEVLMKLQAPLMKDLGAQ